MKKNKFLACLILIVFLAGCAQTVSRPESAGNGALIGAGVGALAGAGIAGGVGASKGGGLGAAILLPIGIVGGAAVGAVIGALIGYASGGESKPALSRSDSKISSER
jgi:hypothetical protein